MAAFPFCPKHCLLKHLEILGETKWKLNLLNQLSFLQQCSEITLQYIRYIDTKKNRNIESEMETKVPALEVRETSSAFQKICDVHKIKLFSSFKNTFSPTINGT